MERTAVGARALAPEFQGKLTEESARSLLQEHAQTRHSLTEFARLHGMTASRLGWWRTKLSREGATAGLGGARAAFLPLVVTGPRPQAAERPETPGCFEVATRGGRVIRVPASFDSQSLRRLLLVLEEASTC